MNPISISLAALALSPQPAAPGAFNSQGLFLSHLENVLGTSFDLKILASGLPQARQAEVVVINEIKRLDAVLSSYRSESEFRQWMQSTVETSLSDDLWNVLQGFDYWQQQTHGAIQAAIGHVTQIWQQAAANQALPSSKLLEEVSEKVNQKHWQLNANTRTATRLTQLPLTLHTFVKSYILDKAAAAALQLNGVAALVLNIGGDLVVRGQWAETIRLTHPLSYAENNQPLAQLFVQNRAVATSGNYRRGFWIQNTWFSHIIDPRTAQPAQQVISATVVHPEAAVAGALATAFNILSPQESRQLATQFPGAEYLIVGNDGTQHTSLDWHKLTLPQAAATTITPPVHTVNILSLASKEKPWDPKQELAITFELSRFEGRSHRPFVAVWIEDEKHNPVRQLAIWYNKPRWLPELKAWYAMQRKTGGDASIIASATRSAGDYTLIWDGKDDHGEFVAQGKYFICVEAAREHGTYQLIRQSMDCNGKPKQKEVNGNVEIKTATLDYREKTNGN